MFLDSVSKAEAEVLMQFRNNNQDPSVYQFLNKYVQWMNQRDMSKAAIDLTFAALRSWCAANGIMLFNEYVKRFVSFPKGIKETRQPLTHEIIRSLILKSPRNMRVVSITLQIKNMVILPLLS